MKRVNKELGITVLIVEQFLDFVLGISDYIYIMEKGSIVRRGRRQASPLRRLRIS